MEGQPTSDLEALSAELSDDALDEVRSFVGKEVSELEDRIDEIRRDMIHPEAARLVLKTTGISDQKAAELVDTMLEVDRKTRGDSDV